MRTIAAKTPKKALTIGPRAVVEVSSAKLVAESLLSPRQPMPLVLQPASAEVDLAGWAGDNRAALEQKLLTHGALLFRGFAISDARGFEQAARAICPELYGEYGDLPHESGSLYRSTPYPADKAILFHNEASHTPRWPMKQWFFCLQPSPRGGETPIADCRQVHRLLPPEITDKLRRKRLMYVRNYVPSLDVSWQDFFATSDKDRVEEVCRAASMEFEWKRNDVLSTRQICPAVVSHPKTGELSFFNQIQLHHVSYLDAEVRQSLLTLFSEDDLPRNVHYGDGTPLEKTTIEQINRAYQQATVSFAWQKGDILMVENMLTAHARNPFEGPRKIMVAMGEMFSASKLLN